MIALHRKYLFSYAPAVVRDVYRNGLTVIFYDKTQQKLPNSEVYKIKHSQYKRCVEYIRDCESRLAKSAVIARDDKTGLYQKCKYQCWEYKNLITKMNPCLAKPRRVCIFRHCIKLLLLEQTNQLYGISKKQWSKYVCGLVHSGRGFVMGVRKQRPYSADL